MTAAETRRLRHFKESETGQLSTWGISASFLRMLMIVIREKSKRLVYLLDFFSHIIRSQKVRWLQDRASQRPVDVTELKTFSLLSDLSK